MVVFLAKKPVSPCPAAVCRLVTLLDVARGFHAVGRTRAVKTARSFFSLASARIQRNLLSLENIDSRTTRLDMNKNLEALLKWSEQFWSIDGGEIYTEI